MSFQIKHRDVSEKWNLVPNFIYITYIITSINEWITLERFSKREGIGLKFIQNLLMEEVCYDKRQLQKTDKENTTWKQGELIKNLFSWKCIYNVSIKSNKGPEKFDISFCVTYQIFLSGRLGTWTFLLRAALFPENFLSHPETPEATHSFFSNIFS